MESLATRLSRLALTRGESMSKSSCTVSYIDFPWHKFGELSKGDYFKIAMIDGLWKKVPESTTNVGGKSELFNAVSIEETEYEKFSVRLFEDSTQVVFKSIQINADNVE